MSSVHHPVVGCSWRWGSGRVSSYGACHQHPEAASHAVLAEVSQLLLQGSAAMGCVWWMGGGRQVPAPAALLCFPPGFSCNVHLLLRLECCFCPSGLPRLLSEGCNLSPPLLPCQQEPGQSGEGEWGSGSCICSLVSSLDMAAAVSSQPPHLSTPSSLG